MNERDALMACALRVRGMHPFAPRGPMIVDSSYGGLSEPKFPLLDRTRPLSSNRDV